MKKVLSTLFIVFLVAAGSYIVYSQLATKETYAPTSDVHSSDKEDKETKKDQEGENDEKEDEKLEAKDETIDLMGEWTRNILNYTGHLTITDATEEEFNFTLEVYAGGNVGSIEGKAMISNDLAIYKDSESGCQLTFQLTKDVITIEQTDECMYWGGAGTFFDGEYDRGEVDIETDLVKQGILTAKEDALFRKVVGDDYDLYLNNMSSYSEDEDQDELRTRVVVGFVRGLAPSNGGIIMVGDEYVYGAVTDSESGAIKYHTNDPRYKKQLPLSIDNWAKSMSYSEVVFE